MVCKQREPAARKRAGLVAVLLALALPLSAQVDARLSQRLLVVGEELTYTILIDHEQPSDVSVRSPVFEGLRLVEGPSIRPVTQFRPGASGRAVEVRLVFVADRAGRFVLPAVPVSVAGQSYLTERHLIEVASTRSRDVVPFRARWSGPAGPLFAGESAVYALEIFNVPEFVYPQAVSIGRAGGAILEEVQGLGEISRIEVDGVTLYTIPVAVFMVTATDPGALRLPAVSITTEAFRVSVPEREIAVEPLPPAVEDSGAVGELSYTLSVSETTVPAGESLQVIQRVTGTGNLHFLTMPALQTSGFQMIDESSRSSLTARENGYHGQLERVTTVRALPDGPHQIRSSAFVSIDPDRRRVSRQNVPTVVPVVTRVREPLSSGPVVRDLEPLSVAEIQANERTVWFDSPVSYGWFVPGILFLIASRFWKRPGAAALVVVGLFAFSDATHSSLSYDSVAEGLRLYAEGEIEQAIVVLEQEHRAADPSPSLEYNLSVLYFKLGDIPRSVYSAREAIRLDPHSPLMRDLLATVESSAGIDRSIAPPQVLHPDLFFLILALSVNGLAVFTAFSLQKRRGLFLIGQLVTGILVVVSFGGLVLTGSLYDEQLGVVTSDYDMRRIPTQESEGWLVVPEGTAVDILAAREQFVLVQTAFGLEGWVSVEQLLWPGNPDYRSVRYRAPAGIRG